MIRVLHIADVHLGVPFTYLGNNAKERRDDVNNVFTHALEFARDPANRIDMVIIAGDLFDSQNPPPATVGMVKVQFRLLEQRHIPVILVPGNHDSVAYPSSIYHREEFPGATLLTSPIIKEPLTYRVHDEDVHIYGMVWKPGESVAPYDAFTAKDIPGIHIAVLHGSITENIPTDAALPSPEYLPLSWQRLAQTGMHYIALGHYHNFDSFHNNRIVYPGTPEALTLAETGERFLVVAEVSREAVRLEKYPINRKTVYDLTIDLTELDAVSDVEKQLESLAQDGGDQKLLRVRLQGSTPDINIEQILWDKFEHRFFFLDIIDRSDVLHSARVQSMADEEGVRGTFIRSLQKKIETAENEQEKSIYQLALKIGLSELMKND